jgi:hypothetical protein
MKDVTGNVELVDNDNDNNDNDARRMTMTEPWD